MDERIIRLTRVFKALSDPTRLTLLHILAQRQGALCVNALTGLLGVTQSAVSQHLRVLRNIDLVTAKRIGPNVHYSMNKEVIKNYKNLFQETLGNML